MTSSCSVQEKVSHDSDNDSLPSVLRGNCKLGTFTYGIANQRPTYTTSVRPLWVAT